MQRGEQAAPVEIDELLKIDQAAQFLNTSRSAIYQLMRSGAISYCRVKAQRRIPKSVLVAYAQRGLVIGEGA